LRHTLRASLLASLADNQGHGEGPFRLFEVGRIFQPRPDDLPEERVVAAGALAGRRWPPSWLADDSPLDFYAAKGAVAAVLEGVGVTAVYEPAEDPSFHPGRCARIMVGDSPLGVVGEMHPTIQARFDLRFEPVSLFELHLDELLRVIPRAAQPFKPLARFPAANRDLALLVATDVPAGRVTDIIAHHRLVERVELFDVDTGHKIPPATKSLAFHVYFQSPTQTLTAEEADRSLQSLLRTLEREVGASLRT
jgi:phenylalanyl-tRNA synthetase beta chain